MAFEAPVVSKKLGTDNSKVDKRRPKKGRSAFNKAEEAKRKRKRGIIDTRASFLPLSPEPRMASPTTLVPFSDIVNMRNVADYEGFILIWIRAHGPKMPANSERAAYLSMHGCDVKDGKYSDADLSRRIRRATVKIKKGKS